VITIGARLVAAIGADEGFSAFDIASKSPRLIRP